MYDKGQLIRRHVIHVESTILFGFILLSPHVETPPLLVPLPSPLLHKTCFLSGSTTRHPVRSNLTHLCHKATASCRRQLSLEGRPSSPHTAYLRSAFFLSSLFNSVCRLLKAIWAGPGKYSVAVVLIFIR